MNIIIPGLHNSDKDHWQSLWERNDPRDFKRIQQSNWDEPDCATWIEKIERDLHSEAYSDLILIGHSIGCMAIVHWFKMYGHKIKGALLVAPSDADKTDFPSFISGFSPIPSNPLPFPTIIVASTDDHVTSLERSKQFANNWNSELVILENAGHIESKSGFGQWDQGLSLITKLEQHI